MYESSQKNLFTRFDLKIEVMENIRQVGLKIVCTKFTTKVAIENLQHNE